MTHLLREVQRQPRENFVTRSESLLRKSTSNRLSEILKVLERILLVLVLVSDSIHVGEFIGQLRQHLSTRQGCHSPTTILDNVTNSSSAQLTNVDSGGGSYHGVVACRSMSTKTHMHPAPQHPRYSLETYHVIVTIFTAIYYTRRRNERPLRSHARRTFEGYFQRQRNTTKAVLVVSVAVPVHENCRTAVLVLVLEFSSSHPHSVFTVYSTSFDSTVHALLNLTVLQCLNTHRMSYALTIMRHLPVACDCTKVHPSRRTC